MEKRAPIAYGYTRVSTDRQVESGISLSHQCRVIREAYDKHLQHKYAWGGVYEESDGVSAYSKKLFSRPMGRKLKDVLRRGDIVIIDKPDRMFRQLTDFAISIDSFGKNGVDFYILNLLGDDGDIPTPLNTASPMGQTMVKFMILFAEVESQMKSARMKAVHAEARAQGKVLIAKYGYLKREDKVAVPDHKALRFAAKVHSMRPHCSFAAIQRRLQIEYCQKTGKKFRDGGDDGFARDTWEFKKRVVRKACELALEIVAGEHPKLEEYFSHYLLEVRVANAGN